MKRNVPDAILGGVCSGIACRLGVRTRHVRLVTAVLSLFFGLGLFGYVLFWIGVRRDGEDTPIARHLEGRHRASIGLLWSLVIVLTVLVVLSRLNLSVVGPYAWSVLLSAVGVVAIWRGASRSERAHLEGIVHELPVLGVASQRGWRAIVWRVIPATILIVIGLQILSRVGGVWGAAVPALIGGVVLIIGVLVMLAPWWLENVRDLSRERRVRVRAEERAALVTHVHDSVLQTLTLIERSAEDHAAVRRLARAQERELRAWLFAPDLIGAASDNTGSFADELRVLQHEIERDYGVRIDLVVVGDLAREDRITRLVAAAREAAINAAKWSGVDHFSIYGEVEPDELSVYVRDTGVGFDPVAVADDRHGIVHSIRARVEQISGSCVVRTELGHGTEVTLRVPRTSTDS